MVGGETHIPPATYHLPPYARHCHSACSPLLLPSSFPNGTEKPRTYKTGPRYHRFLSFKFPVSSFPFSLARHSSLPLPPRDCLPVSVQGERCLVAVDQAAADELGEVLEDNHSAGGILMQDLVQLLLLNSQDLDGDQAFG